MQHHILMFIGLLQTCQVSRIRHETHTFKVYLMLSCLRLKSHIHTILEISLFCRQR